MEVCVGRVLSIRSSSVVGCVSVGRMATLRRA